MSDPTDIKGLDDYLKGGSEVSQRYRELGREEVPPELDRRVLAQARESVANQGAKRSRSWLRWSAPVALAASIVLVLTVALEGGLQQEKAPAPQATSEVHERNLARDQADEAAEAKLADEVARQPGIVPVVPVSQPSARPALDAPRPPEPQRADTERSLALVPPPAVTMEKPAASVASVPAAPAVAPPAQAPEPVAASKSLARNEAEASADAQEEDAAAGMMRARRATGRTAGPRGTISPSGMSAESRALVGGSRPAADDAAERADPQAWLEAIRTLRRAGKADEADREWDRFRKAFPDFRVADDDIARKKP